MTNALQIIEPINTSMVRSPDKRIVVSIKTAYGTERIYPVCQDAKSFASMVKQSTLGRVDIGFIKALGYTVEVHQDIVKL